MADKKEVSSIIFISLSLIEKHEKEYMVLLSNSKLRENILSLKIWFQSLEALYNISNNDDLKRSICKVSGNVMQKLQSLSGRTIEEGLDQDLVVAYKNVIKQIDDVVMDREWSNIYLILQNTLFKTNFDFVVKSLEELSICKANQNAPSIKEKLLLLHDLLAYIGYITIEHEMMHNLSYSVTEIYMALLKSSTLQGFMKDSFKGEIYLIDNVMRLLDCTSSS